MNAPTPPLSPESEESVVGWTGATLGQLNDAVCDALSLDDLRRVLRYGCDQTLEQLVDPKRKLPIVVFDLIEEVRRVGWTAVFARALYNARPNNPKVKEFCDTHARFVYRPPAAAKDMGQSVTAGLSALGQAANQGDPAVRELIRQLGQRFRESRQTIAQMRQYKALHDCLHFVAYSVADELTRAVERFRADPARFRADPREVRVLRKYTGNLERWVRDATATTDGPPPIPFREVESGWINHLTVAIVCLREGMESAEPVQLDNGDELVRQVLARQPARINGELIRRAAGLHLGELSADLQGVVKVLPIGDGDATVFANGLQNLVVLQPRLSSLTAEHGHWQSLDDTLTLVAQSPRLLPTMWPGLRKAGREIADVYQAVDWAGRLAEAIKHYDMARDAAAKDFALDDFRREADERFYNVDKDLRALCDTLADVAAAVTDLLGTVRG